MGTAAMIRIAGLCILLFAILFVILPPYGGGCAYPFCQTPAQAVDADQILYAGVYQAEDQRVTLPEDAQVRDIDEAQFGQAVDLSSPRGIRFYAYGTSVIIRYMSAMADAHGYVLQGVWYEATVAASVVPATYEIDFGILIDSVDSITVIDSTLNYSTLIFGILVVAVWFVGSVVQLRWGQR
jgi:hypothetical protein